MAIQYATLAHALDKYGADIATHIPKEEGAECKEKDLEKLKNLQNRGYRYMHLKAGSFTAAELEGTASKPHRLKVEEISWEKIEKDVPYQTKQSSDTSCTEPSPTHEEDYGWSFKGSYFYSKEFNFFNGNFGRNVYFEGLSINKTESVAGEILVNLDSNLESYNLGNGGDIIIGDQGDPIVEFNGKDITSYVDVEIIGKCDTAEILGHGESSNQIDVSKTYDNNFIGSSCG